MSRYHRSSRACDSLEGEISRLLDRCWHLPQRQTGRDLAVVRYGASPSNRFARSLAAVCASVFAPKGAARFAAKPASEPGAML